jgi:vitamin B12/bleomycin/antimicrobial peptide transport system ATP-binding/permease protein
MIWIILNFLGQTGCVLYLNQWKEGFWNALSNRNPHDIGLFIGIFTIVAIIYIISGTYQQYLSQKYCLKKRLEITKDLQDKYIEKYTKVNIDNPAQRINSDVKQLSEWIPVIGLQIIQQFLLGIIFLGLLVFYGEHYNLPWIKLLTELVIFIVFGTYLIHKIGYKLVKLNYDWQTKEADHRAGIDRLKYTSENDLQHDNRLSVILRYSLDVFIKQKQTNLCGYTFSQIMLIFPFLLFTPFYFCGTITFGCLMMLAGVVNNIANGLTIIINNYSMICDQRSAYLRVKHIKEILK